MSDEINRAIERLKEAKRLLEKVPTKEAAVAYLVKETKLSEKECSDAYDFLMKTDFTKDIDY